MDGPNKQMEMIGENSSELEDLSKWMIQCENRK